MKSLVILGAKRNLKSGSNDSGGILGDEVQEIFMSHW